MIVVCVFPGCGKLDGYVGVRTQQLQPDGKRKILYLVLWRDVGNLFIPPRKEVVFAVNKEPVNGSTDV